MNSHCKHHPEICAGSLHVICAGIDSICVVKTVYSFGTKRCDNAIHQENIQMAVGLFIFYILSLSQVKLSCLVFMMIHLMLPGGQL